MAVESDAKLFCFFILSIVVSVSDFVHKGNTAKKNMDDHISPASICGINVSDETDLRALGDLEGPQRLTKTSYRD